MADVQESNVTILSQPHKLTIFEQEKAQVDIQVATAKQYPRNLRRSIENSIITATLDKETAESCMYSVPRGREDSKTLITGPSVNLAKIVAQNYGNMRLANKVVDIDLKHVTSQAVCWDLETNLAIQTECKRLIIGKTGRYSDDMITVTGNAANSISLRNAIFSVIPTNIYMKVYNAALTKITGNVSDENKFTAKRREIVDALKEVYGVTEKEILSAVGKQAISNINQKDLAFLIGIGTALKEGVTTVEAAFRGKVETVKDERAILFDRLHKLIQMSQTLEKLEEHKSHVVNLNDPVLLDSYDQKYAELLKNINKGKK